MFLSTIDQFCRNNLYKQTIFIGDNLYTFSDSIIKVNDIGTVDEVNSINLPYDENWYPFRNN